MKELFDIDRTTPDINIDRMIRTLKGNETGKTFTIFVTSSDKTFLIVAYSNSDS